ncbi:MAG: Fe-S cluster assembly protein IscX [Lentimicrobiaceae bacterium]|nr:Fe-S cluster assembly protein IscX [Lentimicrobiaceae bacterium]
MQNIDIIALADSIYEDNKHLFPSMYPDIPLNTPMLVNALKKLNLTLEEEQIPEIMQQVELKLAQKVSLNWNNYGTIAMMLHHNYPEENLVAISLQRVEKLTRDLPNFNESEEPDDEILNSIIYLWMGLRDEESYYDEQ